MLSLFSTMFKNSGLFVFSFTSNCLKSSRKSPSEPPNQRMEFESGKIVLLQKASILLRYLLLKT